MREGLHLESYSKKQQAPALTSSTAAMSCQREEDCEATQQLRQEQEAPAEAAPAAADADTVMDPNTHKMTTHWPMIDSACQFLCHHKVCTMKKQCPISSYSFL